MEHDIEAQRTVRTVDGPASAGARGRAGEGLFIGRRCPWPIVLLCIAILGAGTRCRKERGDDADLIQLAGRMTSRPAHGRLWHLPHHPYEPIRRGAARDDLAGVYKLIDRTREADPRAYMLVGDTTRALTILEKRARIDPSSRFATLERLDDAALLNDLAVAYLQRAGASSHPDDLLAAVTAAARGHALAPKSPELAWNYALSVETLGLVPEARAAWGEAVLRETDPNWIAEANRHLALLPVGTSVAEIWTQQRAALDSAFVKPDVAIIDPIVSKFPLRVAPYVEREWVSRWAEAQTSGRAEAAAMLNAIAIAGLALERRTGDTALARFAASAAQNPEAFASAHSTVAEARRIGQTRGTRDAIAPMTAARNGLIAAGSPLAEAVGVELASMHFQASDYAAALRECAALEPRVGTDRPLLLARLLWAKGVALTAQGHVRRADAAYARALELFRATKDATYEGMLALLLADSAELAADFDAVWRHYVDAVRSVERHGDPDRVLVVLDTFARAALRHDRISIAEILATAVLARAEDPKNAPYRCHATISRCEILTRRGELAAAAAECKSASQLWSSLPDEAVRMRLATDLDSASAATVSGEARIAELSRAVDAARERNDLYRASRVLLLRAEAYEQLQSPDPARADLEEALSIVESQRERLDLVRDRVAYFDTSEAIARRLVQLLVAQGATDDALAIVERVRARALLDRLTQGPAAIAQPSRDVRRMLHDREALIEYWIGDAEVLIWVTRREGSLFAHVAAARMELDRAIATFTASAERGTPDEGSAAFLSNALLAPISKALVSAEQLTFIPDAAIANVPFAALTDPASGQFVIQRYGLSRAASRASLAIARAERITPSSLLVLGAPDTPKPLPRLDPSREIEAAALFRHSRVLTAALAQPRALSIYGDAYDAIHIAAHAFDDDDAGPAIALASDADHRDGMLTASEIETVPLRRGALVVLAACSTGRGVQRTEGTMSLARAFNAAGASAVIASLWDVDDAESGELFATFYRQLAAGATPGRALRLAQLHLIAQEPNDTKTWAAYQLIGSD